VCDFTPEEEEEIRRENELLFGLGYGRDSEDGSESEDLRAIEGGGAKTPDKVQQAAAAAAAATLASGLNRIDLSKKKGPEKPATKASNTWFEPSTICRCQYCTAYYRDPRVRK
jgi:hypothetical protein